MTPGPFPLIPREINSIHAARDIAALIGMPINPWNGNDIPRLTERASATLGRPRNAEFEFHRSAESAALTRHAVQHKTATARPRPGLLNEKPAGLPGDETILALTRELNLVAIPGGAICNAAGAPIILAADGRSIIEDCSSHYAGMIYFYDVPLAGILQESPFLDTAVFALFIDADPHNYCHWLLDYLPRLAHLRARLRHTEVYLATPPLSRAFQRETLHYCGFDDSHILQLDNFSALRARELLLLDDGNNFHHPAHNAAPWALDYLRSTVGLPCAAAAGLAPTPRKLFVSRADADRRRVVNEGELMQILAPAGYELIVPSRLSFQQQIAAFASASHLIGPHGAGLANLIFSRPGSQLIELFPPAAGTPAYYMLCAGTNRPYYAFSAGPALADEDLHIDLESFARCAGQYL